jgi:hypothetical protein
VCLDQARKVRPRPLPRLHAADGESCRGDTSHPQAR